MALNREDKALARKMDTIAENAQELLDVLAEHPDLAAELVALSTQGEMDIAGITQGIELIRDRAKQKAADLWAGTATPAKVGD